MDKVNFLDFLKDRLVLLFILTSFALTVANVILVFLEINLSAHKVIGRLIIIDGSLRPEQVQPYELYQFAAFAGMVFLSGLLVSYLVYNVFRSGAYINLFLMHVVLLANFIQAQAVLNL